MKIRRLLVANRGEIARRVMRTARRLGIETVAVYSDADAQSLHRREAALAHALPGNLPAETYLRIDGIIDAARATHADAVHPGYGFLSENADFAQAVIDAGLVWVGPPPQAIRVLGSKSRAKQLATDRGVPCLPGYHGDDQSDERFEMEAARIGYPVMVKAAAGGGGRGMRLVASREELAQALQSARSEAQSAFGSGELLLERALIGPRHVEIQVFADAQGNCIHLGERDCSVQRRHQKIIEETPSPAVDAGLRERMGRCAVELARAAGYAGAGTVEFLIDEGRDFFLMEMNTRLQVEHPVTEAVTGLDLVEWQLRVAQGEPLPLQQQELTFTGHAIEARLCAEDDEFHPQSGRVARFRAPGGVRFDHAMFEGMEVPPWYDSLLGKLIVHAPTREEAADRLARALDATEVLGIATNRRMLATSLRHERFLAGDAGISFLAEEGDAIRRGLREEERHVLQEAAIAALAPPAAVLPSPFPRPVRVRHRGKVIDLAAPGDRVACGAECVAVSERLSHVRIGSVDVFIEDASYDPPERAAGEAGDELRAPFNGKVIAVKAQPGRSVGKGEALVVIESMKLEHSLTAARDGVVRAIHIAPGQQAAASQVLVTLEPAGP